jgi:hypothetical protein
MSKFLQIKRDLPQSTLSTPTVKMQHQVSKQSSAALYTALETVQPKSCREHDSLHNALKEQ